MPVIFVRTTMLRLTIFLMNIYLIQDKFRNLGLEIILLPENNCHIGIYYIGPSSKCLGFN